jgi:Putative auto-transporter adhesin, head GIN domain
MRYLLTCMMLTAIMAGVHAQQAISDPNARVRKVDSFTSITVSSGIELYLTPGEIEAVAVSASKEAARDEIITVVENGVLTISYNWKKNLFNNLNKNVWLKAYVSYKTLEKLTCRGAASVHITNGVIRQNHLALALSGSSYFKGQINVQELDITVKGSSIAKLSGAAVRASMDVSGSSNLSAFDFATEESTVKVSGSSNAAVTVHKKLVAGAKGSSNIQYKGNCSVTEQVKNNSGLRKAG